VRTMIETCPNSPAMFEFMREHQLNLSWLEKGE